jgi:pyrimidine operon attenuation protein / uracil phosphoribosyltransferase
MEFEIQDKDIVLVDDVIYTGRTTRAALDALFDHGRPRRIQMCVLIDRGHRELPIEASFVGRAIQTSSNEIVEVRLQESDGADKVLLLERIPEKK